MTSLRRSLGSLFVVALVPAAMFACSGNGRGPSDAGLGDATTKPPYDDTTKPDADTPSDASIDGEGPADSPVHRDAEPLPVAHCVQGASFGPTVADLGDVGPGAAVSSSGLTVAWVVLEGTAPAIRYADRATANAAFAAPRLLATEGADTTLLVRPSIGRVALSGDGLVLVYVDETTTSFVLLTRATAADAFANPTGIELAEGGSDPGYVGEPVLSADGKQLLFSAYPTTMPADPIATIFVANRLVGGWSIGGPLVAENDALASSPTGERRLPMGLSADTLTLFFSDPKAQKAYAVWRPTVADAFGAPVEIAYPQAQPSATCARLWFTAPAADASGVNALFHVDRN